MSPAYLPDAPVIYLECQMAEAGQTVTTATPWDTRISISTQVLNVVTTGPNFRASTLALSVSPAKWSWRDWRDNVEGDASVDRATLRYEAAYRDRRLTGQCRRAEAPQ